MAYLAREDSIRQWATLVTQVEVTSLKKIQELEFTTLLLVNLDSDYFQPVFADPSKSSTFSSVFAQMSEYYLNVIGTNIKHLIGDEVNIYSSKAIQEIWELILGIAIKGGNREANINRILNMDHQAQEELMRVISKVIDKFGGIVSSDPKGSSEIQHGYASQDASIILELSQQNEQLKQKLEQRAQQIRSIREKKEAIEKELDERKREKKEVLNILAAESYQFRGGSSSNFSSIGDLVKDILAQMGHMGKELGRKDQRIGHLEEMNREIKLAYSSVLVEVDQLKKMSTQTTTDIRDHQKEIQALRSQNEELMSQEKNLIHRIQQLEEQKYYLKGIVQRFESQVNISEQKIDQLIQQKQKQLNQSVTATPETEQNSNKGSHITLDQPRQSQISPSQIRQDNKTVKYEIDEVNEPSLRNKLQREVSHLQKKVNSLQQQNISLKKINEVLEKVIAEFTEESSNIIAQCQKQFEPLYQQISRLMGVVGQNESLKQEKSQLDELLGKVKSKLEEYDSRDQEYKRNIKKLQLQRDQLVNTVKQIHQNGQKNRNLKVGSYGKVQLQSVSFSNSSPKDPSPELSRQPEIQINLARKVSKPVNPLPEISEEAMPEEVTVEQVLSIPQQLSPQRINSTFGSVIEDNEDEEFTRRRQYSFMGNRMSSYKISSEYELGIKEKPQLMGSIYGNQFQSEEILLSPLKLENKISSEYEGGNNQQLFDVTEIEQGLGKIRDKFMAVNSKTKQIYENFVKNRKSSEQDKQSVVGEVKKYEGLLAQFLTKDNPKQTNEKYVRDTGVFSAELVKLNHQNKALRKQIHWMTQEKSRLINSLKNEKQEQIVQAQNQINQEKVSRLHLALNQATSLLQYSQNSYLELQDYFSKITQEKGQGQILALKTELQVMGETCSKQNSLIEQLEMQLRVLSSAFLELRGFSSLI